MFFELFGALIQFLMKILTIRKTSNKKLYVRHKSIEVSSVVEVQTLYLVIPVLNFVSHPLLNFQILIGRIAKSFMSL